MFAGLVLLLDWLMERVQSDAGELERWCASVVTEMGTFWLQALCDLVLLDLRTQPPKTQTSLAPWPVAQASHMLIAASLTRIKNNSSVPFLPQAFYVCYKM